MLTVAQRSNGFIQQVFTDHAPEQVWGHLSHTEVVPAVLALTTISHFGEAGIK